MFQILQISRALAALAVCSFHLSLVFGESRFGLAKVWAEYTHLGYLGVDFFFALSGFIILFAHRHDIGSRGVLPIYATKRFIRIYPLYWLTTLAVLAGASISGGQNRPPDSPGDLVSMLSLVHFTSYAPPVHPAWTLYHELLFYALFAVVLWHRPFGTAVLAAWAAGILGANLANFQPDNAFLLTLTAPVNTCFFAGMGAFALYRRLGRGPAALAAGAGLLLLVGLLWRGRAPDAGIEFNLLLSLAFMLLLGGLTALERLGLRLQLPWLVTLGDASFALYLTHENVQSTALKLLVRAGWTDRVDPRSSFCVILALCIVCALLVYWLLEKPLLSWLRRRLLPARRAQEACLPRSPAAVEGARPGA